MITFTKLRSGDWGLRSARELTEGHVVAVDIKAGGQRQACVGRRIWTDGAIWLYAIDRGEGYDARAGAPSKAGRRASKVSRRASLEEEADALEDQGRYSAADKFRRDHGLWG